MTQQTYKILITVVLAGLFALERAIMAHSSGDLKIILGYAVSFMLFGGIVELGMPLFGRHLPLRLTNDSLSPASVYVTLSLLLLIFALSRELAPLLALLQRPLPTYPLVIFISWWVAMGLWLYRFGYTTTWLTLALLGLVVGGRLIVLSMWPFSRLDGDMLATINRALGTLAAGQFPYINYPPPMPYLPCTFLVYAPARALGVDLRYTNIICDAILVLVVIQWPRSFGQATPRMHGSCQPIIGQLLLPSFMLHPIWIHYSVNSQFAPCILCAVLLTLAVLSKPPSVQAVALGIAVGSNQMLGACGPVLFASWVGNAGLRQAFRYTLQAASIFLLLIAPFLLWDSRSFLSVAFLGRGAFDDRLMAGRLTLLPLASKFVPHASLIGSALVLAMASLAAFSSRRRTGSAAAIASGLCAALLFQPTSFVHYYLPALAMALVIPSSGNMHGNPSSTNDHNA